MAKNSWYAWRDEEGNGDIYKTWEECQHASSGKRGEKHKGFKTYEEAWVFAHPDQPVPMHETAQVIPTDGPSRMKHETDPLCDGVISKEQQISLNALPMEKDPRRKEEVSIAQTSAIQLDYSRAEKTQITEAVNRFCEQFQFAFLSEDQRRAIQAVQGKNLLFAVPGSGKTTVLMARTGYLIYGCNIRPDRLMTMTFTRASAKEMRDRYIEHFHPSEDQIPDFRTIHSFCYSIVIPMLRRAGFRCPFHTINEDINDKGKKKKYTQHEILTKVLKKYLGRKASDETAQETVQTAFSSIKNRKMTENEYSCYTVKIDKAKHELAPLFNDYQEFLRKLDCMDFDDMLVYALEGLHEYPDVLKSLQNTYHYWGIDEAQDNSKIQHELMNLLAGENGNLFMVGDDDQSIYGFRGAEPNMLLEFGNQPDVHLLVMGTNYRSDSAIVHAAKPFVEVNRCRADKNMNASHTDLGEINIPLSFSTEAEQYEYIVKAAREAHRNNKIGILYQLNISALPLIVHLHKAGIQFEASKGLAELLHKKIIGDIFHLLRFSQQPCSMERFRGCRNTLGLYWFTEGQMEQLRDVHQQYKQKPLLKIILEALTEEDNSNSQRVSRIMTILQEIRNMHPSRAVLSIIESPDLMPQIETLTDRLAIYAVLSVCDMFDSIPEMLQALDEMEKAEKLKEKDDSEEAQTEDEGTIVTGENEKEKNVVLSTIHSAKGRQWDRVLLIDLFDETFPGMPQFDRIGYDPEEARRVFYVAVTRPIHRLDILTVGLWHGNAERISRFIPEFAWIVEKNGEKSISENNQDSTTSIRSSKCIFEPRVFYGVPVGRNPGVYTDYNKVEEQVKGFSIPAGKQQKKFFNFEDAWEYTFPGQPMPTPAEKLVSDSINKSIQLSGGATFNKAIEIPYAVRDSIHEHLGVQALQDLPRERIEQLKSECDLFGKGALARYHGHTDGYTVAYMPVNFYKIWLPLWNMLEDQKLPLNATILELGPGPGTATWSLVEFYRILAKDNPNRQFSLEYTAVEREKDFKHIFLLIQEKIQPSLPHNLQLNMQLITETNAFDFLVSHSLSNLDMIIESNMLNEAENTSGLEIQNYLLGMQRKLRENGMAIFIEPGKNDTIDYLESISQMAQDRYGCSTYIAATKSAVYLGNNSLVQEALRTGLRYKQKMEHWFSYMILERNGSVI